jgi:hypothetical protein
LSVLWVAYVTHSTLKPVLGKLINIPSKVYYGAENIFAWIGGRRSKLYELKQIIRTGPTNNWISTCLPRTCICAVTGCHTRSQTMVRISDNLLIN